MTIWKQIDALATPEPMDVFDVEPQSCSHDCGGCALCGRQCPEKP